MKKLFTLLTLAGAFLVANAQVTTQETFLGYRQNATVSSSTDDVVSVSYLLDDNVLFTLSTSATDNSLKGTIAENTATISYEGKDYQVIQIGGQASASGGANFTPTFGENVESVTMIVINNSAKSEKLQYNGQTYTINANDGEVTEIPLVDGVLFNLGSVKFNTLYVIKYKKVNPLTISDFTATATGITSTTATINVSYTVENAADDATYTISYKTTDNDVQIVDATATGGTITLNGLSPEETYSYEISLLVNNEPVEGISNIVSFTTKAAPTPYWSINYAEIATSNLSWNKSVDGTRDSSTGKFKVIYEDEEIIPENIITSNNNVLLRCAYGNNTYGTGLYGNSQSANRYGILDLKEGDVVEIAYVGYNGEDYTTIPTTYSNLSAPTEQSQYAYKFTRTNTTTEYTVNYNVYRFTVTETGDASITVPRAYVAYIKVNPASDEPVEEDDFTFGVSTGIPGDIIVDGNNITINTEEKENNVFVATLVVTAPENATALYYKFEPTPENVSLYADEPIEGYQEATKNDSGKYEIKLNAGEGTLSLYYTDADGSNSEPVSFNTKVIGNTSTAVETIETANDEAVYFNINGVKVQNPEKGVYIKVQNGKASKVIL